MPLIARTYRLPVETLNQLAELALDLGGPLSPASATAIVIEAIDRLYKAEIDRKPKPRKRQAKGTITDGHHVH